jgi:hypothetical protein
VGEKDKLIFDRVTGLLSGQVELTTWPPDSGADSLVDVDDVLTPERKELVARREKELRDILMARFGDQPVTRELVKEIFLYALAVGDALWTEADARNPSLPQ